MFNVGVLFSLRGQSTAAYRFFDRVVDTWIKELTRCHTEGILATEGLRMDEGELSEPRETLAKLVGLYLADFGPESESLARARIALAFFTALVPAVPNAAHSTHAPMAPSALDPVSRSGTPLPPGGRQQSPEEILSDVVPVLRRVYGLSDAAVDAGRFVVARRSGRSSNAEPPAYIATDVARLESAPVYVADALDFTAKLKR
jgi:hypothetical protein